MNAVVPDCDLSGRSSCKEVSRPTDCGLPVSSPRPGLNAFRVPSNASCNDMPAGGASP